MPDHRHAESERPENGPVQLDRGGDFEEAGVKFPWSRDEDAAKLAQSHYQIEPGLRAIYRLEGPDPNGPRIKLLEVNEYTVPTGIVPVGFAPHPPSGLHFPAVVIEVTPQEYEAIQHNQLSLPAGWEIRDLYDRPTDAVRADDNP